jgi:hypothetical protein
MPDTRENQRIYPQPDTQKRGRTRLRHAPAAAQPIAPQRELADKLREKFDIINVP